MPKLILDNERHASIWIDRQENIDKCLDCRYTDCVGCLTGNKANPRRKRVDQLDLAGNYIRTWDSIADACRGLGAKAQNITNCLKGRCQTAHNYKWRYAEKGI